MMKRKLMLLIALQTFVTMPAGARYTGNQAVDDAINTKSFLVDFSSICSSRNNKGKVSKEQLAQAQDALNRIFKEINDRLEARDNLQKIIKGTRDFNEQRVVRELRQYRMKLQRALLQNKANALQYCVGVTIPPMYRSSVQ